MPALLRRPCRAVALLALLVAGCGGGDPSAGVDQPAGMARPSYHRAPIDPPEPSFIDADGSSRSARIAPATALLPAVLAGIDTTRLGEAGVQAWLQRPPAQRSQAQPLGATPQLVTTYTPAQIRAAYGMPPLPADWNSLGLDQAAALGAGQTVFILDAFNYPDIASDLAAFSSRFGLPACPTLAIDPGAGSLPPPAAGCTLSILHSIADGEIADGVPGNDNTWAPEIALDVQWAHATAPLARIVLILVDDAGYDSLMSGVQLANRLGPGPLAMSFGAPEGGWVGGYDSQFSGAGMTYLAASGDAGAGVDWPAVSPAVVAVGGTSLTYAGGARSETAWSGTGGGVSRYEPMPSYQQLLQVQGEPTSGRPMRAVSDVAFNADPYTGQYVALTLPGGTLQWHTYGGTSLATPQWAGIVAVANAQRALASRPPLGEMHVALYRDIAAVSGNYATAMSDITQGADGGCSSCRALPGYDLPTGLGTPNVGSLVELLGIF